MARVTVEDCVTVVPNRFELCLVANSRAKSILAGAATSLDIKEKPAVIALREIAENLVDIEKLRQNISDSNRAKGSEIITDHIAQETSEEIAEETESNLSLKDNIFLEDNLTVED